jgi:serine/threonine protein kinase
MLTRSGVKLLDFCLAWIDLKSKLDETTLAADLTEPGTILGTFEYMAPEQVKGMPADARTDLFAFGSVLYEMLTGIRAFHSENRAELISAILSSEPAPLATFRSDLTRACCCC